MTYPIPKDALDDRLAIVGTAGSGKTYLTLGAVEHLLARKSRVICIDPLGVMWGLRLCADGKTPSPYQPVIFGGAHGDLPITEHAGALIGETVATSRVSCIIDLSALGTKAAERRFMLAFLTALYRHTNKEPVHVIIDEADMFAPQSVSDKEGEAVKLLGMMETIVRRGRVRGFIPWLITQRPAVLNKNVLSQADGLVALKLTSSQDRDQLGDWVKGQADVGIWKQMYGDLATYQRGEGLVWLPAHGILARSHFPAKATFDSSRTPKRGEKVQAAALKPLDLGALKERLATVETEAKANDPKALKAEIAALKAAAAKPVLSSSTRKEAAKSDAAAQRDREAVFAAGLKEGYAAGWPVGHLTGFDDGVRVTQRAWRETLRVLPMVNPEYAAPSRIPGVPAGKPTVIRESIRTAAAPKSSAPAQRIIGKGDGSIVLPPGERAVLIAAAQFSDLGREQLTVLTGYKRSSRDAYIQRLKEKGYVSVDGGTVRITNEGAAALPADYEPLPTGADLQAYWLNRLPEGEKRILQELINAFPASVGRSDLDDATGYKRSSRDAYLQRMKAKRLWTSDGPNVRAAEELF